MVDKSFDEKEAGQRGELFHGLLVLLITGTFLAGFLALLASLGLLVLVAPVTVAFFAVMSPPATAVSTQKSFG